uniref:Rhomboid family intramembrane serine protease n=1 Tax=Bradyrhizobium symbiodeficiens TaxID=1404367 RepID=A0A6G9AAI6_9BRAD|nr:rhomboid family intramembrane serine protease [Bradyrhizobium symbiodeficiens]
MELWRIPVSQLLHARMLHMLFNALWLLLLGHRLERRIGSLRLLLLWLVAGGLATAASPIGVEAPWNVGTGASQALFAFSSCALVLARRQAIGRGYTAAVASTYLAIGLILDLVTAGHPKLGHLAGALLGSLLGAAFLNLPENPTGTTK